MTVIFGLLAAVSVGTSDFLGGLSSRRADPVAVTASSNLVGFGLAFVAALVAAGQANATDVAWGVLGGAGLVGGLVALYAGYARTRVSVAAPVAGVGAAALPVIVTSLLGEESLSARATAGILLGLVAIGLVSIARSDQRGGIGSSLLYGLGGAAGIGLLLLCLSRASEDGGLWPIVAARGAGSVVLGLFIAVTAVGRSRPREQGLPRKRALPRDVWPHVVGIAALVTAGNALFLAATRVGSTSVAAVLTSLFTAVTVFWAWLVFRERLRKVQTAGLGLALVAVALIAAG